MNVLSSIDGKELPVTGRDGEIIFGENDDLGHLWLYFPKIEA